MNTDRSKKYPLVRRAVVRTLLDQRGNMLVVAGLGASAWDVTAAGDGPLNFPLWGAMGGAVSVGLGLALAQPSRRVLVITDEKDLISAMSQIRNKAELVFFNIKVRAEKLPLVLPPKDGAYLKDRFRLALLGPALSR